MTERADSLTADSVAAVSSNGSVLEDGWKRLAELTAARIALGRAGISLPTAAVLEFAADHAMARDGIHTTFHSDALAEALALNGFNSLCVSSRATGRDEYLLRPDLGRCLDDASRARLVSSPEIAPGKLTLVIADGLSPVAAQRHALPLLKELRAGLTAWQVDDIVIATQARVAIADEIGEIRGAEAVLILIGERPGLKSPDSLGAYLTYRPQTGRHDAERNCVSNIRPGGLALPEAASRIVGLLGAARRMGASGVCLKEDAALITESLAVDEARRRLDV